MCPVNSSIYDVIIIGAGISGLGAARILSRESFNILVLEARNRPGGRIHSVRLPPALTCTDNPNPSPLCNHDNLSVFHVDSECTLPSSDVDNQTSESVSSSPSTSRQCSSPTQSSTSASSCIEVDLGANYLIGCSNRQSDQPLFHLARLLKVPTAASVGDLCKKYRGWECIELAVWRNHLQPDAPRISMEGGVEDAVFLFDKVTHLVTQYYIRDKERIKSLRARLQSYDSGNASSADSDDTFIASSTTDHVLSRDSVKVLFQRALSDVLHSEAQHGVRPSAAFRDATEEGLYQSMIARYFCYVNPLDRLPFSILEELCETAGSTEQLNVDDKSPKQSTPARIGDKQLTSLIENLAVSYPTVAQREAYRVCAKRKLAALASGSAGSQPGVAKAVNVRWEDRLVTGRFSDLLQPLLDNVPVVYTAVVREIDWSGNDPEAPVCIRATLPRSGNATQKGEGEEQVGGNTGADEVMGQEQEEEVIYKARHCIITVPVGVLKGLDERSRIVFTPDLPVAKRQAIDRLGLPHQGAATHNKVVLQFRSPEHIFWDADAAHLKCPDPRLHILNLHRYGKPGVLCAHLWGGGGLSPTGLTDAQVVQVIIDLLAAMYPQSPLPQPMSYLVTRWSEDPFALGAYTTGEPESQDADRLAYAATLTSLDAVQLMSPAHTPNSHSRYAPHDDTDGDQGHDDDDGDHHQLKRLLLSSRSADRDEKTLPLPVPRLLFAGEGTLTADEAKECTHGALQTGINRAIDLLPYLTLNSRAKFEDSPSKMEVNEAQFLPDIPRQKIVHYLLGRIPSRKLEINPDYTPLATDDSNGVVDGFVVRRPKRLSTMTSRYSSVWSTPLSATEDIDKEGRGLRHHQRTLDDTVLQDSGGRGGTRCSVKRKPSREVSTPMKRKYSRRVDSLPTDSRDSAREGDSLVAGQPRLGAGRGRYRSSTQYGHRRTFGEDHSGVVAVTVKRLQPDFGEKQQEAHSEFREQPLSSFAGTDGSDARMVSPAQLPVEQLLNAMEIKPGMSQDILSSFQIINDCWPALDTSTRQIVMKQLTVLLNGLKPCQGDGSSICSTVGATAPSDVKTESPSKSVSIDPHL